MTFTARLTGVKTNETERRNSAIGATGKVPNAKKPRSRPPTNFRDKLGFLQGHLPSYSGPYSVGCMDIEVPVSNPRTFSNITRRKRHLLQLETVLFTLYYPAAFGAGEGRDPAGRKDWSRTTWLPRPRAELAKGYGKFSGMPDPLAIAFFASTTMLTKLKAFRNAPLAEHWPPEGNAKQRGYAIKNQQGPPPPGGSDKPTFPLLLFSHGLGGNRTAYSSMCGEFASYGFVVCALEHRDGSGPRTFVNHAHEGEGSIEEREQKGNINHTEEERRRGYDIIDYIFPQGNPLDTSPSNEKGVDTELRHAQIELRLAEVEEAYRVLVDICEGRGEDVAAQNLRRKGFVGGSSRGLEGVDWSLWKNRFHVDKVTAAGHSFGAATMVEVLRNKARFPYVQAGIIYDIWGAPIKPPRDDPGHRIHSPLLGINSEAFMYWQSNFDAVNTLMSEAQEQGEPAFLLTVRGSVHVSQSDFSLLFPHLTSFLMKATVNPRRAIDLNISASLEFLQDVTEGAGKSIIRRCMEDEEILKTDPLEQLPDDNKPDDKHIASRLKIPNEFRTRLAARIQRKLKRKKKHGFYNPGDEVWMHLRPRGDDLRRYRFKRGLTQQHLTFELREKPVKENEKDQSTDHGPGSGSISKEPSPNRTSQECWLGRRPSLCAGDAER